MLMVMSRDTGNRMIDGRQSPGASMEPKPRALTWSGEGNFFLLKLEGDKRMRSYTYSRGGSVEC